MGKIDEKKKSKHDALLRSALKLFNEKGINNTSIAEIAKSAQTAKGTFYLYFKDKYDIRDRLITSEANRLFKNASAELGKQDFNSLEECVIFIADNIIDQLSNNALMLKFISKNLSWAIFSNIRITDKDNMSCMSIFQELIKESGRKFRQEDLMVFMIVELVNSTCYNAILYKSPVSVDELKPDLYDMIRKLIGQFEIA